MSAVSCLLSEAHFLCSICLDVFTSPVTIPCGHNFCKTCITSSWWISSKCQCPVCKKLFHTTPELHVNTFISEMASQFRQSSVQKAQEDDEPGDVPCDVCTGIKLKALKSCLVCLASYCETHLARHQTLSALKKHKLIEPLDNLQGRMCPKHDQLMDLFCKTDQVFMCQFCTELDHESHDVVPVKEACEGKKTELGETEAQLQQMIQERQLKIQELRQSADLSKQAADKQIADGVRIFTAVTRLAEMGLTQLTNQIKKKQKMTVRQAEDFIKKLSVEISEVMRRNAKVKQLLRSGDHFHILQSFSSLNVSSPTTESTKVSLHQPSYEGTVARAAAQLNETLRKGMETLLEAELRRVQQYAVELELDPNTAHPKLTLSDDGKQVNHSDVERNVPDNPERFSFCVVVMAKQSFSSGRFYYEVEVKGKTKWDLGVASESANRKGQVTSSPEAGYWTLQLRDGNEYTALADPDIVLSLKARPQKVGVFVDCDEGLVSFYDVDCADIIFSFAGCAFTEKLYPFFSPCFNDDGGNSAPLRISVVHKTE